MATDRSDQCHDDRMARKQITAVRLIEANPEPPPAPKVGVSLQPLSKEYEAAVEAA